MLGEGEVEELVSEVCGSEIDKLYCSERLKRLTELLEQAEQLLDIAQFHSFRLHSRESYQYYAFGGFYVWLIIPNSIQFQINNREYSKYLAIKKKYLQLANDGNTYSRIIHFVQEKSQLTYEAYLHDVIERTSTQKGIVEPLRKKAYSFSATTHSETATEHRTRSNGARLTRKYLVDHQVEMLLGDSNSLNLSSSLSLDGGINKDKEMTFFTISSEEQLGSNVDEGSKYYKMPIIPNLDTERQCLSICGIRNLGNTCYMNSMLQCLFGTKILRDLLVSGEYEIFKTDSQKPDDSPSVCDSMSKLFVKMYTNGGCCIIPSTFMEACKELRPDFNMPFYQQDSQEFLMYILDRLQLELTNTETTLKQYPYLKYHFEHPKIDSKEYKDWLQSTLRNDGLSPLDYIFRGEIENMLQCRKCDYSSYTYSSFYILSLNIPKHMSHKFYMSKKVKLEDCINLFTRDEILEGDNAWTCPNCQKLKEIDSSLEVDSVFEEGLVEKINIGEQTTSKVKKKSKLFNLQKKIFDLNSKKYSADGKSNESYEKNKGTSKSNEKRTIENPTEKSSKSKPSTLLSVNFLTLPPILIIHLSRFFYDISKKNETVITYHMNLNIVEKDDTVARYRLFGVINHDGSPKGGHYTSMVNMATDHSNDPDSQRWIEYDDEIIEMIYEKYKTQKALNEISSNEAYVLFYERVDN